MHEHVTSFTGVNNWEIIESPLSPILHDIWRKVFIILRWFWCEKNSPWVCEAVKKAIDNRMTPVSVHPPGHYGDTENFLPSLYRFRIYQAIHDIFWETDQVFICAHSSWAYGTLSSLESDKLRLLSLYAPALIISEIWNYNRFSQLLVKKYASSNKVYWVNPTDILEKFKEDEANNQRQIRWAWYIKDHADKISIAHNLNDPIVPYKTTEKLFWNACTIKKFWYWNTYLPFQRTWLRWKLHVMNTNDIIELFKNKKISWAWF